MKIYCCNCLCDVHCGLVSGADVYPHRPDLKSRLFWRHEKCGGFVGCHDRSNHHKAKPLGVIASAEIKKWRQKIHAALDPLWQQGEWSRHKVYQIISQRMGPDYHYHTAEIRSVDEARKVLEIVETIERERLENQSHQLQKGKLP